MQAGGRSNSPRNKHAGQLQNYDDRNRQYGGRVNTQNCFGNRPIPTREQTNTTDTIENRLKPSSQEISKKPWPVTRGINAIEGETEGSTSGVEEEVPGNP